MGHE
jgi:hypothetical protein